ncbi:uncharacterized protein L3040_006843 [Drepanopeziza brunnea f. sp. 'multigermtubi']|uniref:uncharacterized protein n=1 Tax=Drepanopeziza brunnea f. sp. 'multigermtubi' TaxID=698441 RepID=UPI00238A2C4F|nr:hypothetical protein L3040_006843 [Drepanopeziza brunnea f. sp. 'multigermtubi']
MPLVTLIGYGVYSLQPQSDLHTHLRHVLAILLNNPSLLDSRHVLGLFDSPFKLHCQLSIPKSDFVSCNIHIPPVYETELKDGAKFNRAIISITSSHIVSNAGHQWVVSAMATLMDTLDRPVRVRPGEGEDTIANCTTVICEDMRAVEDRTEELAGKFTWPVVLEFLKYAAAVNINGEGCRKAQPLSHMGLVNLGTILRRVT